MECKEKKFKNIYYLRQVPKITKQEEHFYYFKNILINYMILNITFVHKFNQIHNKPLPIILLNKIKSYFYYNKY